MPIRALLNEHSFGPDDIKLVVTAFEEALQQLSLVDRARVSVDPARLRDGAVRASRCGLSRSIRSLGAPNPFSIFSLSLSSRSASEINFWA